MKIMFNIQGQITTEEEQAIIKYDRGSETIYLFNWVDGEFIPLNITECQTMLKLYEAKVLHIYFYFDKNIILPLKAALDYIEKDCK